MASVVEPSPASLVTAFTTIRSATMPSSTLLAVPDPARPRSSSVPCKGTEMRSDGKNEASLTSPRSLAPDSRITSSGSKPQPDILKSGATSPFNKLRLVPRPLTELKAVPLREQMSERAALDPRRLRRVSENVANTPPKRPSITTATSRTGPENVNGLLGPIRPAGGPPPSEFAGMPVTPPKRPLHSRIMSTPGSGISPGSSPIAEVTALKIAHQAHINDIMEEHALEIKSLRTHITLLERQASLPNGQHLSPSGLLPRLDTSANAGRHRSDSEDSTASKTSTHRSSIGSIRSFEAALGIQKKTADDALIELQHVRSRLQGRDHELDTTNRENMILKQSLQTKDRTLAQMKNALSRAAEMESSQKTKLADAEARYLSAKDKSLDLEETYGEARAKARLMFEKNSLLQKELNNLRHGTAASDNGDIKATVIDLEDKLITIRAKLNVERDRATKAEADMQTARTEADSLRSQIEGLRSQAAASDKELGVVKGLLSEAQARSQKTGSLQSANETKIASLSADLLEKSQETALLKVKVAELQKEVASSALDMTGTITIANTLDSDHGTGESHFGRLDLLRHEVRNISDVDRRELAEEIRRLEADSRPSSRQRSSSRSLIRKLEAERDQLSSLLSTEIRRAARASASGDDFGLSRLERSDSVLSTPRSLRHLSSTTTLAATETRAAHSKCEEALEDARDSYEKEINGLVKEIVLYKLDIKGYKKDLRKANTTIEKLQAGKSADGASDTQTADWLERVERPEPLRTRSSTTNLILSTPRRQADAEARGPKVTNLTISAVEKPKLKRGVSWDTSIMNQKDQHKDSMIGPKSLPGVPEETRMPSLRQRPSTRHLASLSSLPTLKSFNMDEQDAAEQGHKGDEKKDSAISMGSAGAPPKDGMTILSTKPLEVDTNALMVDDDMRPLSTVAEVGSAVGSAVSSALDVNAR